MRDGIGNGRDALPRVRAIMSGLADVVWPRTCAVEACGRPVDRPRGHICSACFAALPFHEPGGACRICGMPVPAKTPHAFICEACAANSPPYERTCSAVDYAAPIDMLVQAFKYNHASWLAEDFAELLDGAVRAHLDRAAVDAVFPVPLHPNRLRKRGYNQVVAVRPQFVRGRVILLVDDVTTTGSTLAAAAEPLRAAGAAHIWCATLARAPHNS